MTKIPSHILFVLNGTLTDPKEGITNSIVFALERMGISAPPADDFLWCIGPPLHSSFAKILGSRDKADEAVAHYRERYTSIGMYENRAYEGTHDILARLRDSGFTLYLATSKLKSIADQIISH